MKEFDNLEGFLEHVSLATSVDQEWEGEKVNMMTMHGAKGLEFDVVFLTWLGRRTYFLIKNLLKKKVKMD